MSWLPVAIGVYVQENKLITVDVGQREAAGFVKLPVAPGVRLTTGFQGRRGIARGSQAVGDGCQQMLGTKGSLIGRVAACAQVGLEIRWRRGT
jgi:hypothetical protein